MDRGRQKTTTDFTAPILPNIVVKLNYKQYQHYVIPKFAKIQQDIGVKLHVFMVTSV